MTNRDLTATAAERIAQERVAILPAWMAPGWTVWYWRDCLCCDDLCMDMVSAECPLNRKDHTREEENRCSRRHPVLDSLEVYAAAAIFTERGLVWSINELPEVSSWALRDVFFPSRELAERHRPKEVAWGANL